MRVVETDEYSFHEESLQQRMRSEERRISSQHEQLDVLCREVYLTIDKNGPSFAINDFLLFATALDAHMTVEEDIYFPALYAVHTDAAEEFASLIDDHHRLRRGLDEVRLRLKAKDRDGAKSALDRLARQITKHEMEEEGLLARITEGPIAHLGHSSLDE